ncbi:Transglycosylase-associated protein OS=Tsukamurella paurometabola (strain ATCC 8368 / DSM /CCUG 35730 / CIP 100753 / JCM 10117 / KCTC 9821 / NBRC 16120/ NCIMB 702349 / NCTC 13040) OX=521096 GN=Tpau_3708 PE=3 SV=1 [Tsukamurella paurometabola]|uniref:Transglycosylase-associated protein n=1 Tax=Tsukamurella paurometabola (strain ATCC 8368 / DSM 20162 / CCUG 35730 / CIP 100753 / JCM 10117 / KCTC 9821 / NBRC 16120 / NCIMB 702349 / NCTC 13040) TaxID=521096 RepID=D5UYI3_TSUPD|nr:GlsB/YeaQ/YmgE family stress response membrane protein [Tsukamurella paurometabola]ADG80286.1 Transglycosylase-associated protein [Tsukamurella paurometabola DSM 20162]SUP39145.1 Transglycosylase associated protein [Tsukamurella paurometabola]
MITQYTADTVMLASKNFSPGWFAWIIIGGLAGWIASKIMGTDKSQGIILNVVVGCVGGWLGGYVLRLFDVQTGGFGWFLTFVTALVGACILLFVVKLVTGRKG